MRRSIFNFFDSHGHYDHPRLEGVLDDSMFFVGSAVIPAITYESNFSAREKYPKADYPYMYFAAGVHPKYVSRVDWNSDIQNDFEQLLKDERTVAVKTGLDYSDVNISEAEKSRQMEFLDMMIAYANSHKLPLVFHVRDSMDALIHRLMIRPLEVSAEVHCFNGTVDDIKRFQYVGVFYFGIGGMITRENTFSLREAVEMIPDDRLLLETDIPFLKPRAIKGKNNTPLSLYIIASEIARIKKTTRDDVARITRRNACRFFNIENKRI